MFLVFLIRKNRVIHPIIFNLFSIPVSRQQIRFALIFITHNQPVHYVNVKDIRFDFFLQTAPPTIVLTPNAPSFTIITANEAFLTATETKLANITGMDFLHVFPQNPLQPKDSNEQNLLNSLIKAIQSKQKTTLEGHRYDIRIRETKNWEIRYWTATNSPIVNDAGEVECLIHITQDITAAYSLAKKERIALDVAEAQRKQLHEAYQQAPVGIGLLRGRELKIEFGNDSILQVLGKKEEIIGKTVASAIPELENQPFLEILDKVFTSGKTYYGNAMPALFEQNEKLQQGFYNFIYHPLKNADGETTGIMVIGINVTKEIITRKELEQSIEQKSRVEEALRSNQARLQGILDTMAEGVAISDAEGNFVYTNPTAERMIGISKKDLKSRVYNDEKWLNLRLDGSLLPIEEHPLTMVLTKQKPVCDCEIGIQLAQNKRIFISINAAPMFNAEGELTGCISTFTDVTHRRKLINRLAESESFFRGMFEQAPLGMCLLRGKEQIIEAVNDNILKIWGYKKEEVIGLPQRTARPELMDQGVLEWLDEVFVTGKTRRNNELKVKLRNRAGGIREAVVNSVYQPITDGNGEVIGVLMITDEITEKYFEKQQALHTQEMFKLAVESAALGTWYYDIESGDFVPSVRLKEIYGFGADEEMSYNNVVLQICEEYKGNVMKVVRNAYESGEAYDLEYPVYTHREKLIRWVKSTGKIYPAQDGKPARFSGTFLDITERKTDDIRKNDFIAMVSHELKTPLTSMKAFLQVVQLMEKEQTGDSKNLMEKADQQINKMTNLINSFLNISRLDAGKIQLDKSRFTMDKLIKNITDDMSFAIKEHHIMYQSCHAGFVFADYEKMGQVLNNFISNAAKYSSRGTVITIECHEKNNFVQVCVKDNGRGIAAHHREHLFDRFYHVQNKDNSTVSGFGIGLYLCAEIVHRHDGKIWVESDEGKGSTFFFEIPVEINAP